jgi:small-conductance mechanosensitive channel
MQNSQNIIDTTATASQVLATPTEALATLTQAAEPTQMNTLLQPIINHPIVSSFLVYLPFLKTEIFGNTILKYILAVLIFFFARIFLPVVWNLILNKLGKLTEHTSITFDDLLISQLRKINSKLFWLAALFLGLSILNLPYNIVSILGGLVLAAFSMQIAVLLSPVVDPVVKSIPPLNKPDFKAIANRLSVFVKTALFAIAGVTSLGALGINVAPLFAGLGVLGIGGALAFQQMIPGAVKALGFHFSKPFSVGDVISSGVHQGIVEEIDITTTKIKSGDKFVDVPNDELMGAVVLPPGGPNILSETLKIKLNLENDLNKILDIENILKKVCDGIGDTTFDKVKFTDLSGGSILSELSYNVLAEKRIEAKHMVILNLVKIAKENNISLGGI